MTVRLDEFERVQGTITKDSRGRVALGPDVEDDTFMVSRNSVGQILLTPVVTIPKYEAWLWADSEAYASVQRGLQQAAEGNTEPVDYSEYADLEIDD